MSLPQQHRRLTKKNNALHQSSHPSKARDSAISALSDASSTQGARLSLSQHSPHFDQAIFDNISYDSIQPQTSPTRPLTTSRPPPPATLQHAQTYDERLLSPKLRLSDSAHPKPYFQMDRTPPRETYSSDGKSQRYSDEVKPESAKKSKSMFSALLSGVKGTPRRPTISSPVNPTHVTHVSIDNETGKYTVCLSSSTLSGFKDCAAFISQSHWI